MFTLKGFFKDSLTEAETASAYWKSVLYKIGLKDFQVELIKETSTSGVTVIFRKVMDGESLGDQEALTNVLQGIVDQVKASDAVAAAISEMELKLKAVETEAAILQKEMETLQAFRTHYYLSYALQNGKPADTANVTLGL